MSKTYVRQEPTRSVTERQRATLRVDRFDTSAMVRGILLSYLSAMQGSLRAKVIKGRLVLNEPTDLPEGAEVELRPTHERSPMSPADDEILGDELEASEQDLAAGRVHTLDEIIADFRARRA